MTNFTGKPNSRVSLASPTMLAPGPRLAGNNAGPAARWIAPSTPPPPNSELFAALTMASTDSAVMSASTAVISIRFIEYSARKPWPLGRGGSAAPCIELLLYFSYARHLPELDEEFVVD